MMTLAQPDDLQLLPDSAELIWGVVAFLILLGLLVGILSLVVRASRGRRTQEERMKRLEERLDRIDSQ